MSVLEKFVSEDKGRGLRAKEDVKAGTLLLPGIPFAYVLNAETAPSNCHRCLATPAAAASDAPAPTLRSCSKCKFALYCDQNCQKAAWPDHKTECAAIKKIGVESVPEELVRLVSRTLFKRAHMEKDSVENDDSEIYMKSTELEALDMNLLNYQQKEVLAGRVEAVKKFWPKGSFPFTDDDVLKIFLQIKNNAFMLADKGGQFVGTAHHVDQSLFNHSCIPNAGVVQNSFRSEVRALQDIEAGEEILINYLDPLATSAERKQDIKERYGFDCGCMACSFGTNDDAMTMVRDGVPPPIAKIAVERAKQIREEVGEAVSMYNLPVGFELATDAVLHLEQLFPDTNLHLLRLLLPAMDTAWRMLDMENAEKYCERIVAANRILLANHPIQRSLMLTRLGMIKMQIEGKSDEALAAFSEAEPELVETHGMQHPSVIELFYNKKITNMQKKMPSKQRKAMKDQATLKRMEVQKFYQDYSRDLTAKATATATVTATTTATARACEKKCCTKNKCS